MCKILDEIINNKSSTDRYHSGLECHDICPGKSPWYCTRDKGHPGVHVCQTFTTALYRKPVVWENTDV